MTSTELLQIVTGFLGSLFFAILFNVRGKKLLFTSIGGFLSWTLFVIFKFITPSEPLRYFFVAVLISIWAEIFARILKTPTTTFIMSALIPLIPGGALYYTMSSLLAGSSEGFLEKSVYTLELAGALALGIVLTSAVVKILIAAKERHRTNQ